MIKLMYYVSILILLGSPLANADERFICEPHKKDGLCLLLNPDCGRLLLCTRVDGYFVEDHKQGYYINGHPEIEE